MTVASAVLLVSGLTMINEPLELGQVKCCMNMIYKGTHKYVRHSYKLVMSRLLVEIMHRNRSLHGIIINRPMSLLMA
jgi:hypothetical protein